LTFANVFVIAVFALSAITPFINSHPKLIKDIIIMTSIVIFTPYFPNMILNLLFLAKIKQKITPNRIILIFVIKPFFK